MSGESRIIKGEIAQGKLRGKAFIKEIGRLIDEATVSTTKYAKSHKK